MEEFGGLEGSSQCNLGLMGDRKFGEDQGGPDRGVNEVLQDSPCPIWDSNRTPPKYEFRALPIRTFFRRNGCYMVFEFTFVPESCSLSCCLVVLLLSALTN